MSSEVYAAGLLVVKDEHGFVPGPKHSDIGKCDDPPMRSVGHSTQRAKCVPETFESHKPSVPELLLYIHSAAPNSIPPNITRFSLSRSVLIRKIIASGSAYYLGWLLPSYSVDE